MLSANEIVEVNQAQRTYARLAGILMLGAIVIAIGGGAILSNIAGNGSFAETAARIAASERLYRLALSIVLIVTLSSTLLWNSLWFARPAERVELAPSFFEAIQEQLGLKLGQPRLQ
jgi:hypothetical protein